MSGCYDNWLYCVLLTPTEAKWWPLTRCSASYIKAIWHSLFFITYQLDLVLLCPLLTHSQVQVQVQVQAFVSALWHAVCLWTHCSFICFVDRPSVSSAHMSEEDPRFVQVQSFSILLLSWPAFVQWLKAFSFGFQWFSVRIPFFHSKFLYILLIMHFREIVESSPTKRQKKSIPGSPDIQSQPPVIVTTYASLLM